jgi:DNA polymerase III delta prime subunit
MAELTPWQMRILKNRQTSFSNIVEGNIEIDKSKIDQVAKGFHCRTFSKKKATQNGLCVEPKPNVPVFEIFKKVDKGKDKKEIVSSSPKKTVSPKTALNRLSGNSRIESFFSGGGSAGPSLSKEVPPNQKVPPKVVPVEKVSGKSWTELFRPRKKEDLFGNEKAFKQLDEWLTKFPLAEKKAVLLCGPPGVGKTSAAQVFLKKHGYEKVEINASLEFRTPKAILEKIQETVCRLSLENKKMALVVDEVDGMFCTKTENFSTLALQILQMKPMIIAPIIFTCNDLFQVKDLDRCVEKIRLFPCFDSVAEKMIHHLSQKVSAKGSLNEEMKRAIVKESKGDLRHLVTELESFERTHNKSFTRRKAKGSEEIMGKKLASVKDMHLNCFQLGERILFGKDNDYSALAEQMMDDEKNVYFIQSNMTRFQDSLDNWADAMDGFSQCDLLLSSDISHQEEMREYVCEIAARLPQVQGKMPGFHDFSSSFSSSKIPETVFPSVRINIMKTDQNIMEISSERELEQWVNHHRPIKTVFSFPLEETRFVLRLMRKCDPLFFELLDENKKKRSFLEMMKPQVKTQQTQLFASVEQHNAFVLSLSNL